MSSTGKEVIVFRETLPGKTENRILVLGSDISGAQELRAALVTHLGERVPDLEVEVLRNAAFIELAFLGRDNINKGRTNPSLPKGVILLPEMRQYDPYSGAGMSIPVHYKNPNYPTIDISEFVEDLCTRYNVPLIEITEHYNPELELCKAIKRITGI